MSRGNGARKPPELDGLAQLAGGVWPVVAAKGRAGSARILFVGTHDEVGASLMTAATAVGLARNLRQPVCVVEANLERPGLARYFDVAGKPGLSDVLDGTATTTECSQIVPGLDNLTIVTAGTPRKPLPGEFAGSPGREILAEFLSHPGFLLFDAAPVVRESQTRLLFDHVDAAVVVMRARSTRQDDASRTLEILQEAGVPVLGGVLNRYKSDAPFGVGDPHAG